MKFSKINTFVDKNNFENMLNIKNLYNFIINIFNLKSHDYIKMTFIVKNSIIEIVY